MTTVPRNIKIGSALGLIGGLASIVCMVLFFQTDTDDIATVGIYMLMAVLFFALAGAFTKTGQWSWNVLLFMAFLTVAIVFAGVIMNVMDVYAGAVLAVIGALMLVDLARPSSRTWIDRERF